MRSDTARKGREHEEESKNLLVVFGAEFARCCGVLLRSVSLCGVLCGDRQHRLRAICGAAKFYRRAAKRAFPHGGEKYADLHGADGATRHGFGAFDGAFLAEDQPRAAAFIAVPIITACGAERHGRVFLEDLIRQNGLLIRTLVLFGVPHESLIQLNGRMAILVFVFLWKTVSYNTILFWSGLNWIPKTYYEQMALEGGGHLAQFRQVTWIYLAPTTFVVFLMSVVNAFKVFKEIYMLFGAYPGPDIYMLQHYMNNLFAALNLPRLSSIAYILFVCIGAVLLVVFRLQKRVSDALE